MVVLYSFTADTSGFTEVPMLMYVTRARQVYLQPVAQTLIGVLGLPMNSRITDLYSDFYVRARMHT